MEFKRLSVLFLIVVCVGFVSAGSFSVDSNCSDIKAIFDKEDFDFQFPDAFPFGDDVFDVYLDDGFLVSFELVSDEISGVGCEVSESVNYNVFVTSGFVEKIESSSLDSGFIDFYNDNKASGDLKIEAVGIGKKLKLGFINFGLKVAGWFS
jgi:hypothetical protein